MKPAFPDDGFVPVADRSVLVETLCRHEERVVARDNTVAFESKRLQLPESPLRHHWVGAKVKSTPIPMPASRSSTVRGFWPVTTSTVGSSLAAPAPR
ncbi:MAG: hypothetical protein ACLPN5_17640 [Roseiarcus sp.]